MAVECLCEVASETVIKVVLTCVRFLLKTGSDTVRSFLVLGKEQESKKNIA